MSAKTTTEEMKEIETALRRTRYSTTCLSNVTKNNNIIVWVK